MPSYRLEEAKSARAGCQNKECKDQKIKIQKGELRHGTWVETERIKSFMWRHWGCVTPKIIAHLNETIEELSGDKKDPEAIDGYEDLSPEYQQKVAKALEQGHVDDEEWNGDVEMNRPGKTGFRVRGKKAADKDDETDKEPTPSKKRGRPTAAKKEESDEPAPKPKRSRKTKPPVIESEDEMSPASDDLDTEVDGDSESEVEVKPKKPAAKRGRPAAAKAATTADKKTSPKATPKAKAKAKTTKKAAAAADDGEEEDAEPVEKPKRGRKKKTA